MWEPKIEIRRDREGVFSYDLYVKLESKTDRPIPDELKPKIVGAVEVVCEELDNMVAKIFNEYEEQPIS